MSFEGYTQKICENGHYHTYDVYEYEDGKCPICESGWKWSNLVDLTNGSYDENGKRIDNFKKPKLIKEATHKKCDHCGSKIKLLEETVYAPPD